MFPPTLQAAINTVRRGLHETKREALDTILEHLNHYHDTALGLIGPVHVPPSHALTKTLPVAKPSLTASYWQDGPWHCLRIEERTIGFNRPRAWFNPATKRPQLRHDPATEQWMGWVQKVIAHMGVQPLTGSVRVLLFPGLVYTFMAWCPVPHRAENKLHPMDADNAAKPTLDSAQVPKPPKGDGEQVSKPRKDLPQTGAYFNDTQVVDLLVYRLPQQGAPPVDRIALHRKRSATRKTVVAKKRAKAEAMAKAADESQTEAGPEADLTPEPDMA